MKRCEYCGGEVPDETLVCPNCAAHFPPLPPPRQTALDDPSSSPQYPESRFSRLWVDSTLRKIGLAAVVFFALYLFMTFLGVLGSLSPILILPVILLVAAGVIVWRVK